MTARLRFPAERSRLRKYAEPEGSDGHRGPFQHDRDRIVHSRAFRRLAGKTQVATLPDSIHCRTRLTHTVEVAQVARSVASALELNVDLVEALALGHDLGHPPFGHVGEVALDEQMRPYGYCFDHNTHSLRVVERELRYAAFPGLNLTFEVREGLLKHSRDLPEDDSWQQEYLPGLRPPLEAQLIDPADEIAYLCADMEDAIEGGLLRMETVCANVPAFAELQAQVRSCHPETSPRRILNDTQRRLVGFLVTGLLEGTRAAAERSGATDYQSVWRLPSRIAVPTERAAQTMREMRAVLQEAYYNQAGMQRGSPRYGEKLGELFRHYIKQPETLPESYEENRGSEPLPRLVCDYIAGMTDAYLLQRHKEFIGGTARAYRHAAA